MSKKAADEWALRIQLEKEEARVSELKAENERLRDILKIRESQLRWEREWRPQSSASGVTDRELRDLIFEFHPDRKPGGLDPTVVARALIKLRDKARS